MTRGVGRALLPAALGFALTLAYAALVQPAWEPGHTDQLQYLSLARGFADRGEFTRAIGAEPWFPETYRLPGYPLLLAPLCLGGCDHWRIAIAQAALVALLVLAAHGIARRLVPARATTAALAVALFLPFAYYGALALSDLPGAVLFGLGLFAWISALEKRSGRLAIAAGALFGWAALIRGVLLFAPLALAAVAILRDRGLLRVAAATTIATAVVFAPYVAYSVSSYGRVTGGTGGLVLWLGVFQGRDEASLDVFERAQADAARVEIAAFDAISDREERSRAWLALDDALGARARSLIAHDPVGWVLRAVPRSLVLWAGERPVPGGGSADVAVLLAAAQLVLFAIAACGVVQLARRGDPAGTAVAVAILYVWLSALPFQTEARYALPAKMPAIVAAIVFVASRWPLARVDVRADPVLH